MSDLTINTYLTSAEYRLIKGIDLDLELRGSSDEDYGDAERYIFRVEQKMINYLANNYDFEESMLTGESLKKFKLAVCEQIENQLAKGREVPVCEDAKAFLRTGGLMNMRSW